MEKVMWESKSLEKLFYGLPFLPFRGVRDNLVAEYRYLNKNRKSMRKEPLDWKECIRKRFAVTAVFEPSPPEILELLRDYR